MTFQETGSNTPKKREGRVRLSPRDPLVETLLGGIHIDGLDIEKTRLIIKKLCRDRNQWDIERRRNGLASHGKLSKAQAEKALGSALNSGRTQNSLVRRGGGE